MMKKEYIAPEMIIRRVILEGMIAQSLEVHEETDENYKDFSDGDAKIGGDKSFNVWED